MQLHVARLCLDCQEVHAETECPVCTSRSFVPLSRWVPAEERRVRTRPDVEGTVSAYRQILTSEPEQTQSKWPRRAALLIATVGAGTWIWRKTQPRGTSRADSEP